MFVQQYSLMLILVMRYVCFIKPKLTVEILLNVMRACIISNKVKMSSLMAWH